MIFLFFVTVELPCHLVVCERTRDYGQMFVTVTTRQPQLQPLSNRRVNDALLLRCFAGFHNQSCKNMEKISDRLLCCDMWYNITLECYMVRIDPR